MTPPPLPPHDAAAFRASVQAAVDTVISDEAAGLRTISPDLVPLTDALGALMRGGKRFRPAFCYWGWRASATDDDLRMHEPAVLEAASALEFLQACALIHDDVMDGSDTRRGLPAAHRRFQDLHADESWVGSSAMFGIGAAILLGDLCLSWADQMFLRAALPPAALDRAKSVFDIMRTELMAGQYLDLLEQARANTSIERAQTVVRYKSAKYTIERPLHLGAALAGADAPVVTAYSAFGLALGEAFQLRDDVLGVFGDPAQTGKPAGDDLREGKRTVLVALAHARASAQERAELDSGLGSPDLPPERIARLRAILTTTGALDATEALIEQRSAEAHAALDAAPISAEGHAALAELADAATQRAT
ncbi:MAG: polyprenyl synthetase family protein [Candidatus Nanopelagicales bacterium]|nr:polyprenyl synthetase family protein [Candidatus Nanopelagicales bacterium]